MIEQRDDCKEINCEKHVHCPVCNSARVDYEPLTTYAYCRGCYEEFNT